MSNADGECVTLKANLTAFKGGNLQSQCQLQTYIFRLGGVYVPLAMRLDLEVASHRTARSCGSAVPATCRFTTASYCPDIDHADAVTAISRSNRTQLPCFELAVSSRDNTRPDVGSLLSHRPVALLSLVPRPAVLFTAGALSGAIGKTLTAPLDRVKLLLQTSGGLQKGAVKQAVRQGGVWQALVAIGRTEGIKGYWKGNLPQVCTCFLCF